ncbi:SDR family oxidoreductase [Ilyomonas limi]|uniref:SDR family oxidoreductase n=1 Tax=Ilyomonas limi TaxID=2575867 RepID=A0A4U3L775_9BACT|nr:glucose 1-dehydrogenase [Ilyomonas limi]TKK70244.1 SDR family oxidoreductase [Ilyomonas limi]
MDKYLSGKTAIVTGGASGIGEATALLYAEYGANVVVSDIHEMQGNKVVKQIQQHDGKAIFVKADVSQPEACEQLVNTTVATFGSLDIAFNNAGIGGESSAVGDMSIEGWNKVITINLNSVFYCMKYQLLQMQKQGSGAIVNNSSILGSVGFANAAGYVAAKHGVIGLTQTAALEYSAKGIRINAIGPAFINTPLLTEAGMDNNVKQSFLVPLHPIGRLGESKEVAELVVWLSSDKASFVTGSYYAVDGGYLAR